MFCIGILRPNESKSKFGKEMQSFLEIVFFFEMHEKGMFFCLRSD